MKQLLPPIIYVILLFLLTQVGWSEFTPQRSCRAPREQKSCFAFILVNSILLQSEAANETKCLKWQQQFRIQHSSRLDYNTWPATNSSLLFSLYFFFITRTIECKVTVSGVKWKACLPHLFKSKINIPCGGVQHSNFKIKNTRKL